MPRGRKKAVDPSEEIAMLDQKIADLQDKISDLKQKRKSLMSRADEAAKQKIIDAFIASGKTAEEFLNSIKQNIEKNIEETTEEDNMETDNVGNIVEEG